MERTVLVRWQRYRQLPSDEIYDLAKAAHLKIVKEITFRSERPHKTHFIPVQKLEELEVFLQDEGADILLIDGHILPHQVSELETRTDCEVLDKVLLVLRIFEQKASSKDVQLQIELAKLIYSSSMVVSKISQNVQTERQARERGVGEQITDIAKTNINHRIAKIRRQLGEMAEQTELSVSRDGVYRLPVLGFYSAGKSTLFNMLTGSSQEIDAEAFTTMFSKIQRSKKFGYPLDFVDTVGLVDLPNNVLNAFNLLLEPLFAAEVLVVVVDSSLLLDEWERQFEHIGEVIERFSPDKGLGTRVIVVHSKSDLTDAASLRARSRLLKEMEWLHNYREIATSAKDPEQAITDFKTAFEDLAPDIVVAFRYEGVTPSALSQLYERCQLTSQVWRDDGTCDVEGLTLQSLISEVERIANR